MVLEKEKKGAKGDRARVDRHLFFWRACRVCWGVSKIWWGVEAAAWRQQQGALLLQGERGEEGEGIESKKRAETTHRTVSETCASWGVV